MLGIYDINILETTHFFLSVQKSLSNQLKFEQSCSNKNL